MGESSVTCTAFGICLVAGVLAYESPVSAYLDVIRIEYNLRSTGCYRESLADTARRFEAILNIF
jgi:hypothetical protein